MNTWLSELARHKVLAGRPGANLLAAYFAFVLLTIALSWFNFSLGLALLVMVPWASFVILPSFMMMLMVSQFEVTFLANPSDDVSVVDAAIKRGLARLAGDVYTSAVSHGLGSVTYRKRTKAIKSAMGLCRWFGFKVSPNMLAHMDSDQRRAYKRMLDGEEYTAQSAGNSYSASTAL